MWSSTASPAKYSFCRFFMTCLHASPTTVRRAPGSLLLFSHLHSELLACLHHCGRHVVDGLPLERNDGKPCGHCIGTVRRTVSLKPQATYARPTAVFKAFFPPSAVSRQFIPTCYTYSNFMVKYCIKISPCHFIWMRMRWEGVDQQLNSSDGYSESVAAQRVHSSSSST